MTYGYTYEFPDPDYFLNTVQAYLIAIGKTDIAKMLDDATCSFASTGSYSGRGNDHHGCILFLTLPLKLHFALTEASTQEIMLAADEVMPRECGFDVMDIEVSPLLERLPLIPEGTGLNSASDGVAETEYFPWDGLRFRSPAEIDIYKVLKTKNVLFFPNPAAVLGGKGRRNREPDFLICQHGKWGILEIMGKRYHTSENASHDHTRADDFEDYGVKFIKFRDASECMADPKSVVEDFLRRLSES